MPQGCATPSSAPARQREPRPASHATLPLTPHLTLPLRRPNPSPHTRLLTALLALPLSHICLIFAQSPPPLCVCPRSDKVLLNYQAEAAYVPEEPPKDTVVKKKRKAPAGRMVTSSKGAKLPF